jgi:hypothetical protein
MVGEIMTQFGAGGNWFTCDTVGQRAWARGSRMSQMREYLGQSGLDLFGMTGGRAGASFAGARMAGTRPAMTVRAEAMPRVVGR